jgi:hypothetical protein
MCIDIIIGGQRVELACPRPSALSTLSYSLLLPVLLFIRPRVVAVCVVLLLRGAGCAFAAGCDVQVRGGAWVILWIIQFNIESLH